MKNEGNPSKVYVALLHYPVYNRNKEVVTSAVTNLDIHDIARLARTYSLAGYFIVTPDEEQAELVKKICSHWLEGYGSSYNFDRGSALSLVSIVKDLKSAVRRIEGEQGKEPGLLATTALEKERYKNKRLSFVNARETIECNDRPQLIILGTAWGLSDNILREVDHILEPVKCNGNYNHLSVRTAAAIVIDRLLGNR
ncbi:MAG: RNA methyltransferase [Deltaproteobacteria bacterium]|nr:RNA methyltransferase [Deltaproteobacteria bacterium]